MIGILQSVADLNHMYRLMNSCVADLNHMYTLGGSQVYLSGSWTHVSSSVGGSVLIFHMLV